MTDGGPTGSPRADDRRESDRRTYDRVLADQLEEQDHAISTIGAGQTALEHKLVHDIEPKLDKTIEIIEGRPIRSTITDEVIGHAPGLASNVEAIQAEQATSNQTIALFGSQVAELADAINGGTAIRHQREWTQTQRWVTGILITLLGGILITLIPIAIEIQKAAAP